MLCSPGFLPDIEVSFLCPVSGPVGFHPSLESMNNKFYKHFSHMQPLLLD